jgi:hypothetical protein
MRRLCLNCWQLGALSAPAARGRRDQVSGVSGELASRKSSTSRSMFRRPSETCAPYLRRPASIRGRRCAGAMHHRQSQRGRSMTIKVSARAMVRSKASPEKLPSTTQPSPAIALATRPRKLALSDGFQPGRHRVRQDAPPAGRVFAQASGQDLSCRCPRSQQRYPAHGMSLGRVRGQLLSFRAVHTRYA